MNKKSIRILFVIAAIYDGLLGAAFLFCSSCVFKWFAVTPPNHAGYVHFAAALLLVFTVMFLAIAKDPEKNRNLILYGILLKVSYCGVVGFHWLTTGIPTMWKPFCIFDLCFLALFILAGAKLRESSKQ
jgi:hypothetical protein